MRNRAVLFAVGIVVVQTVAAIFFVLDSIEDIIAKTQPGITFEIFTEGLIAFALMIGVVMGARQTRKLMMDARRREDALAVARGALSDIIKLRFDEWQLSPGESEVALFAIKGCSISEIAQMRNAATGTVRSQLSQVYLKARVTSQSMLISLFIEELL
ncbi:MAG: helix-turn-helix transcriptional regulator [Parasphingorhabdus sp.]|uniref:helix-turn-helix transcriptional regulator n=1 Tax=Parasphingorhabdus sp. TaxID=2709688 RepID=UPI0030023AE2